MMTTYQEFAAKSREVRNLAAKYTPALKKHNLTPFGWAVVGIVHDFEKINITSLAREAGTSLAFVTTLVNTLEARNILLRSKGKDDSRIRSVSLTQGFKKKFEKVEKELLSVI